MIFSEPLREVSVTPPTHTHTAIFPLAFMAFSLSSPSFFFPTLRSSLDILNTHPHKVLSSSWLSALGQSYGAIISDVIQKGGIRDIKS